MRKNCFYCEKLSGIAGHPMSCDERGHEENRIFTYGTLRDRNIQLQVLGRALPEESIDSASIRGWRYGTVHYVIGDERVAFIAAESEEGTYISGYILHDLTDNELIKLDDYEGDKYVRLVVKDVTGRDCWMYAKA